MNRRINPSLFKQFKDIGRDLFTRGLVSSHAGNMSVRIGNTLYVTARGTMLGRLKQTDIIRLTDKEDTSPKASSETPIHRSIYNNTDTHSIIHTHPPYGTLLSMIEDVFIPLDWEGSFLLKKVPVLVLQKNIHIEEKCLMIGRLMKNHKAILIRGHGSFVRGNSLEEAYMLTSSLESSAFFVYNLKYIQKRYRYKP